MERYFCAVCFVQPPNVCKNKKTPLRLYAGMSHENVGLPPRNIVEDTAGQNAGDRILGTQGQSLHLGSKILFHFVFLLCENGWAFTESGNV